TKQAIELELGTRVTAASLKERSVTTDRGKQLSFDTLVLSLGGTPRQLPGIPAAANVHTLRSLRDSSSLRRSITSGSRMLLVGAGFIGAEVAASARKLGKDVLIVEAAPVPLERALGKDVGEIYAEIHRDHGVDLRASTQIKEWHSAGDQVIGVTLSDGRREEVDVVLIAVGITQPRAAYGHGPSDRWRRRARRWQPARLRRRVCRRRHRPSRPPGSRSDPRRALGGREGTGTRNRILDCGSACPVHENPLLLVRPVRRQPRVPGPRVGRGPYGLAGRSKRTQVLGLLPARWPRPRGPVDERQGDGRSRRWLDRVPTRGR